MHKEVRQLFILDIIRRTGNSYPTAENFAPLEDFLQEAVAQKMLSIGSTSYEIGPEGKKALLLFDDERKKLNEPLNRFKEIAIDKGVIDGRLPMMAFILLGQHPLDREALMKSAVFSVFWEDLMSDILEDPEWQKTLMEDEFYDNVYALADVEAWKRLGASEFEAKMTGKWLLNPAELTNKEKLNAGN